MKHVTFGLCTLLLSGCASLAAYQSYEGTLEPGARARLLGAEIPKPETCIPDGPLILFSSVDGQSTDHYFGGYDNGCRFPSEVLLQPGEHNIQVFFSDGSSPSFHAFCLLAEAGKTYKAKRNVDGYKVSFSAIEVSPTSSEPSTLIPAKPCGGS